MDFEYKPISLEGPAFRLLRLLKGKGNSDPIQCQLFESKLALPEHTTALSENIRDYAAVSYTWGSNSRPCKIIVNGSNFGISVTKNKTRSFGLTPFALIKAITMNEDSKSSRWDPFIARRNE
jgi:hypothetical protein